MKKNLLMVLALMLVMMGCSDSGDATDGAQDTDDADFARTMGVADSLYTRMQFRDAYDLYLQLLYQAPGLWDHFHFADMTREAMRAAGLPQARGTFVEAYASFVRMCVENATSQEPVGP